MAASPGGKPEHWCAGDAAGAYTELDHPADLFLEIRGHSAAHLVEQALFALFDQIVDLRTVRLRRERSFTVREPTWPLALRHTLAEALALFNAEGFLAAAACVEAGEEGDAVRIAARLWGENRERERHTLQAEIKAVTYHRLLAERVGEGTWRAEVLFDV